MPNRKEVDFNALALQFGDLSITKSLAKGREPLQQIGDIGHGQGLMARALHATAGFLELAHQKALQN
jgi:hypothetical protein